MTRPDLSGITRAIQVRHIAIPIEQAIWALEDEPSGRISKRLIEAQFTHAPVKRGGKPVGLFEATADNPDFPVSSRMRPLEESLLVSADTSLSDLPAVLAEEPFLFVFEGRRISGFVAPSDMGSAPARTHFYLQLSQLEILLAELIRRDFPDQSSALVHLTPGRKARAEEVQRDRKADDRALDVVATVALLDLIAIARHLPRFEHLATEEFGADWKELTSSLPSFRNDVMHPVREFTRGTQEGMRSLVEHEARLRCLTRAGHALLEVDSTASSAG